MTELDKIKKWNPPIWHEDFGNPKKELELLKEFCNFLLSKKKSNYSCELDCFEEGYMSVEIVKDKIPFFTVEVVDLSENKLGLFFENGDEHYLNINNLSDLESILV